MMAPQRSSSPVSGWPASTSPDGISGQLPASGDRLPCSRGSKLQGKCAAGCLLNPAGSGCSPACRLTSRASGSFATTSPWVRARHPVPQLKASADLVGTSLVESGVVKVEAYIDAVETLIARFGADRYFAHRQGG